MRGRGGGGGKQGAGCSVAAEEHSLHRAAFPGRTKSKSSRGGHRCEATGIRSHREPWVVRPEMTLHFIGLPRPQDLHALKETSVLATELGPGGRVPSEVTEYKDNPCQEVPGDSVALGLRGPHRMRGHGMRRQGWGAGGDMKEARVFLLHDRVAATGAEPAREDGAQPLTLWVPAPHTHGSQYGAHSHTRNSECHCVGGSRQAV